MDMWYASVCEYVWNWCCLCDYHFNMYEVIPSDIQFIIHQHNYATQFVVFILLQFYDEEQFKNQTATIKKGAILLVSLGYTFIC